MGANEMIIKDIFLKPIDRSITLNSLPACDYTLTTLGNFSKNIENRINLSL